MDDGQGAKQRECLMPSSATLLGWGGGIAKGCSRRVGLTVGRSPPLSRAPGGCWH